MRNLSVMVKIFVLMMCLGSIAGRDVSWDDALSLEEFGEAAGYGMEKLSSVLVTGDVVCDACLDENIATHPEPISGAVVGVACGAGNKRKAIRARGVADRYGDFIIDLPSDLHANPYLCRCCWVAPYPISCSYIANSMAFYSLDIYISCVIPVRRYIDILQFFKQESLVDIHHSKHGAEASRLETHLAWPDNIQNTQLQN